MSLFLLVSSALSKMVEEADSIGMRHLAAAFNAVMSRLKDLRTAEAALLTSSSLISLSSRTRCKVELMATVSQSAVLRVLRGRSIGVEEEVAMTANLGIACHDSSFAASVAALAKQLKKASALTEDFMRSFRNPVANLISFNVISRATLSSAGAVVTGRESAAFLPPDFIETLSAFEKYYGDVYKKKRCNDPARRLLWQFSFGSCVLVANPGNETSEVEIQCSPYQMGLLLELDRPEVGEDGVSYGSLRKMGIPEDELQSALLSLSAPRHPIISVRARHGFDGGSNAQFTDEDRFVLNGLFPFPRTGSTVVIRTTKVDIPSQDSVTAERVKSVQGNPPPPECALIRWEKAGRSHLQLFGHSDGRRHCENRNCS